MIKLIAHILILLCLLGSRIDAEEDLYHLQKIITKNPLLATRLLNVENEISAEANQNGLRTDLVANHTRHDLSVVNGVPHFKESPISFESREESKKTASDYYEKVKTKTQLVITSSFSVKEEGQYFIKTNCSTNSGGKLNALDVLVDRASFLVTTNGQNWVHLKQGKYTVVLLADSRSHPGFSIINRKDLPKLTQNVITKLNGEAGAKYFSEEFYPQFLSSNIIFDNTVYECFSTLLNKFKDKLTNENKTALAKHLWNQQGHNTTERCFRLLNSIFPSLLVESLLNEDPAKYLTSAPTSLARSLYYSGQADTAETFFNAVIESAEKKNLKTVNSIKLAIYAELAICNMHIGEYENVISYANKISKISDSPKFNSNLSTFERIPSQIKIGSFKPASASLPTDNVAESLLFEISDLVTSFDNSQEPLNRGWRLFENTQDKLVLGDKKTALSLIGKMIVSFSENEQFSKAFKAFAQSKIKDRVADALQENNYSKLEALFNQFGSLIDLPQVQQALFKLSYQKGNFANAIYHGESLQSKKALSKTDAQTLHNLKKSSGLETEKPSVLNLGSLWSQITMPPFHSQYTAHLSFDMVQPNEIYANESHYYVATPNNLTAVEMATKKTIWEQNFGNEYQQSSENGPFQKRSFLHFFGNSIAMYGPSEEADNRAIYVTRSDGTKRWSTDQFSEQVELEPICTPIFAANKLFTFSITKRDTIRVLYLTVIDSLTGKYIKNMPISRVSTTVKNRHGNDQGLHWNTYRHDEHFVENNGFIYAYTGAGSMLKIEPITNAIIWLIPFHRIATAENDMQYVEYSKAPSGFIKIADQVIVTAMPDIQMLMGVNKETGKEIWKSLLNFPHHIHSRNNSDNLIISRKAPYSQTLLIKINMQTGERDWQTNLNALTITGEGEIIGNQILLPVQSGLVIVNVETGVVEQHIPTDTTFDKVRFVKNKTALFSNENVWLLNNDGKFNSNEIKPKALPKRNIIEPDVKPSNSHLMDFPDIEASFQIPETSMTTSDRWRRTQVLKTSKPFYHIMKSDEKVSLISESFTLKNNTKVPPAVIWQEFIPYHQIIDDTILISKPGLVTLENLFTRELIWQYKYNLSTTIIENQHHRISPLIASDKKFVALQLQDGDIRILDFNTQKVLFHHTFSRATDMALSDGILLLKSRYEVFAYDLNQNGKYLWKHGHNNRTDIHAQNGMFIFIRYSGAYTITFYDIKTGTEIAKVKCETGDLYRQVDWEITDSYIYAYNCLYDRKTGALIDKAKEACPVKDGGFLCFTQKTGKTGFYYENGKKYPFTISGARNEDNPPLAASKKGNEIFVVSVFFSERFKIENDKLVSTELISNSLAIYGNHGNQTRMDVYPLDDSFLLSRENVFSFIKDFTSNEGLNTFETYQASDDVHWPNKESYPESRVPEQNWVSKTGTKPDFSLHYQIGINSEYAYLKFRLGAIHEDLKLTHRLKIRTTRGSNISYITWRVEDWETAQPSHGLQSSVSSWKQIDSHGNINLFVKLHHGSGILANRRTSIIGQLGIEVASYEKDHMVGFYRIGGAAIKSLEPFPWKLRYNQHSNHLENILKRENLYDELDVLFPQGYEISSWLTSRRKVYGVKNNIEWLNKTIPRFKDNFGVVNFISALVLEEIINSNFLEADVVNRTYKDKIKEICSKVNALCEKHKINPEWAKFALSVFCIEAYPNKTTYNYSRDDYFMAASGQRVSINKSSINSTSYGYGSYDLELPMYKPHLLYFFPGLITGYPQTKDPQKNTLSVSILGVNSLKSNFGEMNFYSNGNYKTIITADGKPVDVSLQLQNQTASTINKTIYWQTQQIPVYALDKNIAPQDFTITIPNFPTPVVPKGQGITTVAIKKMLDNLPTDSDIGFELIEIFKSLDNKDEVKMQDLMIAWIKIVNKDSNAMYNASTKIFQNAPSGDRFAFMKEIWKEARVPISQQRIFMLRHNNTYRLPGAFSFMGPIQNELTTSLIGIENFNGTFSDGENSYKFENTISDKSDGHAYWVTKISVTKDTRANLFIRGSNHTASSLINCWLKGQQITTNASPIASPNSMISERLSLKNGENILIVRIDIASNGKWADFALTIGDNAGLPIEGLKLESVIQEKKK